MNKFGDKTGLSLVVAAIIAANPEAKIIIDENTEKYNYVFSESSESGKRNVLIECTDNAPMITSPDHLFSFDLLIPSKTARTIDDSQSEAFKEAIENTGGESQQLSDLIADYLDLPRDQIYDLKKTEHTLATGEDAYFLSFALGNENHSVVDETFKFEEMDGDPNAGTTGVYLVLGKPFVADVYPNRDLTLV